MCLFTRRRIAASTCMEIGTASGPATRTGADYRPTVTCGAGFKSRLSRRGTQGSELDLRNITASTADTVSCPSRTRGAHPSSLR